MTNGQKKLLFNPKDIQYYDHILGELSHSQNHKARKFIELDRIKRIDGEHFQCLPIKGYNIRTYDLCFVSGEGWTCNCQGFNKRKRDTGEGFCSHLLALLMALKEEV